MAKRVSGIYFDREDEAILALVNRILEKRDNIEIRLLNPNLHPHGIKELVATPVARMASAVVNLLRNLETEGPGHAEARLVALETLYDEVLSSAHSSLRRNTARVLMQIMKDMVRVHGDRLEQLRLAHDFRRVAHGTPRVVRAMLKRYHLPEMPEEWNQLAFDDHIYDANTKGRKTPTHLMMDAWIKGLRSVTVAYEYCVDPDVARELLRAGKITDIAVRIGLEFHLPFYDRFVGLFWIPRGFSSDDDFLEFLQTQRMTDLMAQGREVLQWRKALLLQALAAWNAVQRPRLADAWGVDLPELTEEAFMQFVGRGQPSLEHLAECLYLHVLPQLRTALSRQDGAQREDLAALKDIGPETILDDWLSSAGHPEMPDLSRPFPEESLPRLLRLGRRALALELIGLNPGYRLVLDTVDLSEEDVIELLWDCDGAITHLEIFNMRGWIEGRMASMEAIGELQRSLTLGQGPRVKQMVRQMIQRMKNRGDLSRADKFRSILHDLPALWQHYRHTPLKTRLGTGSVSRKSFGMGLVFKETLTRRGLAEVRRKSDAELCIPIRARVEENLIYRTPENPSFWQRLGARFAGLPGCRHLGKERRREWKSHSEECRFAPRGNVANLGGLNPVVGNALPKVLPEKGAEEKRPRLGISYLNSSVSNWLKVLLGFIPAFFSFYHTQDWWVLVWFGSFIWFGITGVRNVIQMVLAAKGASRGTLVHWKSQVNVSRLCDSLMYTGISVLLLEVGVRVALLQDWLGVTVADQPFLVYAVLNVVNGLYIFAHNVYRGFPKEAAIGNLFRSAVSIPVASFFNFLLYQILALGVANPDLYIVPSAAVISKLASDVVAAVIEGYADSQVNLRMRRWDYQRKLARMFACHTRLEMLFPQEDALRSLSRKGGLGGRGGERERDLELAFIINALDLMYIWYYQPRAQDAFRQMVRTMPEAERMVMARAQLVLTRDREISQLLVDGLLGRNFSRPLAFFLDYRKLYLHRFLAACRVGRQTPAPEGGGSGRQS